MEPILATREGRIRWNYMVEKCVTGMNEFLNKPGAPQWDHHNSQRPRAKTVGN